MSMYQDKCWEIAARHDCFEDYVMSKELTAKTREMRERFDPEHPDRFHGSQRRWDELVYRVAIEAWHDVHTGNAPEGLLRDLWDADDSIAPGGWSAYQFESDDDEEPVFFALVEPVGDTFDTEVCRYWNRDGADQLRGYGFRTLEAAMRWCESWAYCPRVGQGVCEEVV